MGDFLGGLDAHDGGGDELHVAAFAFPFAERGDGEAVFTFHEAVVEGDEVFGDVGEEFFALGEDFGLIGEDLRVALLDGGEVFGDEGFGFFTSGFGSFLGGAVAIDLVHGFEFLGFEGIEVFFVADDFVAEGDEFLVFAGFELLVLQALDGGAAGLGIELDFFDAKLAIEERLVGLGDGGLITGELGFGTNFVLRDSREVFGEREEAAIAVLEDEEGANFFLHGSLGKRLGTYRQGL